MDGTQKRHKSLEKAPVSIKAMDDEDNGGNSDAIDRISNLPNEILCHILSFLPTRTAIATSILSTKWKNLFPLIPNLEILLNDSLLLRPEKSSLDALFMSFVDRLLNVTLRDTPSISTFHLNLLKINDGREIGNWVTSALRLNVKKMDIRNCRLRNSSFLFDSLFGCNLVTLNLMLDFIDEVPKCWFSLPNLKVLIVQNMKFKVVNVILEGCPLLTELWVCNCYGSRGEMLRICLPSLNFLYINSYIYFVEGRVELDVPNLRYFNYCGYLANRYLGGKLKSLFLARLDVHQNTSLFNFESIERAKELINLCSGATKLWLSDNLASMLYRLPVLMPRFENLYLIQINDIDSYGWKLIPNLLDYAPNLETLVVRSGFKNESYESLKASLKKKSFSVCLSPRRYGFYALKIKRALGN